MRRPVERVNDVLGISPNWNQAVLQEVEFDTEIRVTRSGVEQREALRQTGRTTYAVPFTLTHDAATRVFADVRADPFKVWVAPVAWRRAELDVQADEATDELVIDDPPFWAVPGAWVVVDGQSGAEAARIAQVAGDVLTLTDPLLADHEAAARVSYGVPVRFPEDVRMKALLPDVYTALFAFEQDPGRVPEPLPARPQDAYRGNDVFLRRPNWRDGIEVSFTKEADRVDFKRGRIHITSPVDFTSERRTPKFYRFDTAGAEQMLAFFQRQKGRRGSFWAPSWTKDFRLSQTTPVGGTTFTVHGLEHLAAYAGDRVYRHVIHVRADGTWQANEISGWTDFNGNSRATCTASWQRELRPDSRLYWLFRSRFTSDTLSMAWETPEAAHAQFSMTTLPADEAPL